MKCGPRTLVWILGGIALGTCAGTPPPGLRGGPYDRIAALNAFRLHPAKVDPPPIPKKELPKITLLGITTILGDKRAVLKVQWPAESRAPAKEQFYILAEGQRAGGIEVLAIDEKARRVEVRNDNTLQVVEF